MFKDNENCSTKTEEAIVEHVNQGSKLKPFAHLSATSAKPVISEQPIINGVEKFENSPARENLGEEKTLFQENQNSSTETEATKAQLENQNNGNEAAGDLPANSDQPLIIGDKGIENSLMKENLEEEKTMFQENQNCSTETETTDDHNENLINEKDASGEIPVTPDKAAHENGDGCDQGENSLLRENSTTEVTEDEKKLYNKIKNRVKAFTTDNRKRIVTLWFRVGEDIDKYYEGDYGKSEMKRISDNTGIGISTLYKAVQFANNFNDDDIKRLLAKDYISFRLIVESFPIGKLRALQVFETSSNAKEAQRKINEIKQQESAKGTTSDDGADSTVPDSNTAPDSGVGADKVLEETDSETDPADQASEPTEPQSPEAPPAIAQTEGSQDGQGASGSEQPSTDKKSAKKKQQDTVADNNKEVSKPDFFGQAGSEDSFSYLFETMNKIGTKLVNTSIEKPANVVLRKIIQDTMMDLSNLLALVPEASCIHSGVTLSEGAAWESSCQSVALQV